MKRTITLRQHWRNGRAHGYPTCCIVWYFVWRVFNALGLVWRRDWAHNPRTGIRYTRFGQWWVWRGPGRIPCPFHLVSVEESEACLRRDLDARRRAREATQREERA